MHINKLIASYERVFGLARKTTKITFLLMKEDRPEIDDSASLAEEGMQSLIGQLQWAMSLGRFDIAAVAIMMRSAFRSTPTEGHLDQVKQMGGHLCKPHSIFGSLGRGAHAPVSFAFLNLAPMVWFSKGQLAVHLVPKQTDRGQFQEASLESHQFHCRRC
jgi:hypothetical protein